MLSREGSANVMKILRLENLFTRVNFVHATTGATAGAVALALFYPLDTARTRLQVDDKRKAKYTPQLILDIYKEEGLNSLYRGIFPVLVTLFCSNFVYFFTYKGLKGLIMEANTKPAPSKDLLIGYVAGVINVLVTTPLWVVNTRLKLQDVKIHTSKQKEAKLPRYFGIIDALWKICRLEGVSTLWNGTVASVVLASNPSIQFMVYENIKRYFQHLLKTTELSGFLYFVIGAVAKIVATIVTYPLQIVQSRMRTGFHKQTESKQLLDSLLHIIRVEGFRGLYKGMEAKLLQTVLTAALMFLIYEKLSTFVFKMMNIPVS